MAFYSIAPLVMASICGTLAFSELLTWARMKGHRYDIAFAITCLAAAIYDVACAGQYNVELPLQSVPWLRMQSISLNLTSLSFLWYLSGRTRLVPKGILGASSAWFGLCALLQIVGLGDLLWIPGRPLITTVNLPFGLQVVYREVESGIVTDIMYFVGFAFFIYFFLVVIRYRARSPLLARPLFWLLGIVSAAYLNDFAVSMGIYPFLYLIEYAWLAAVVFVGLERSSQLIEAAAARDEMKKTGDALRESERRYRAIFESLQDVYFRTDSQGILRLISPSVRAFGYEPEAIVGSPVDLFFQEASDRQAIAERLAARGSISDFEIRLKGLDSRLFDVSLNAHPVFDLKGEADGTEGIMRDVTDRKKAEAEVLASLAEKNVLLKEIHHRVKNNLQIISSLLFLQEDRIRDPGFKAIVQDCRNQVFSMALIHEDLYRSEDFHSIDFGRYLGNLVKRLLSVYRRNESVDFTPRVESVNLGIDKAIPCGLIVNELCTNALKYAFPDGWKGGRGGLTVELDRFGKDMVRLIVSDNGVGLPQGMELEAAGSLGMQIVTRLVSQLHGSIRLEGEVGARFVIEFPR